MFYIFKEINEPSSVDHIVKGKYKSIKYTPTESRRMKQSMLDLV